MLLIENVIGFFGGTRLFLLSVLLFYLVYEFVLKSWFFFQKRNVKFRRGLPILGTYWRSFIFESVVYTHRRVYKQFPNERFFGIYDLFGRPTYFIRDPELIKKITITDFDHFTDRIFHFNEKDDPLTAFSVFGMPGNERWRQMRATLSPAFTASKMKLMHSLINECALDLVDAIKCDVDKIYRSKDLFAIFASDIIASCAFGIKVNSANDKNNEFFKMGRAITTFTPLKSIKFLCTVGFPRMAKFLKFSLVDNEPANFMRKIIQQNISERLERNTVRNDMIDLLISAQQGKLDCNASEFENNDVGFSMAIESNIGRNSKKITNWTPDEIVAQCSVFYAAGLHTISNGLSLLSHELAIQKNIQEKLYNEIKATESELNGKQLTYDVLSKMKYLDMILSETLRRWTPVNSTERACTKPYVLENSDGTKVQLNVNDGLWIAISSIHMDEKYYPNPEKFDPERFSDDNKSSIKAGTFIPFGSGPRNCVGSRFAIIQMKTIIYYLVNEFEICRTEKTMDPLILTQNPAFVDCSEGCWIQFKQRNK